MLLDQFENAGQSVGYYAACGSRPSSWIGATARSSCGVTSYTTGSNLSASVRGTVPGFSSLLQSSNPQRVIINLGDNMFRVRTSGGVTRLTAPTDTTSPSRQAVIQEIQTMLNQIPAGKECFWVGPTYHTQGSTYAKSNTEVDLMYAILVEAMSGKCSLIDNRSLFTQTAPNDGLHLINSESRDWGLRIAGQIQRASVRPERPSLAEPQRIRLRDTQQESSGVE